VLVALGAGCARLGSALPTATVSLGAPTTTISPSLPPPTATAPEESGPDVLGLATLAQVAPTRTPEPTATPDELGEAVETIIQNTGLSGRTLLWLGYADWINLGISLLYLLGAYLIGTWLIRWLFPRLVVRTKTNLDDLLLKASGNELRWLAMVILFRFSVNRLSFVYAGFKTFVADISFFLSLFLVALLAWRLINLATAQAEAQAAKKGNQIEVKSLIVLSVWGLRLIVIIMVITLLLTHFGVNITAFAFFLGVLIVVVSLAGRDLLADIIAGAMILVDRPFRIGDRLELPSIASWGDVVEIGMRSTKIISMENRTIVIPNSLVAKNQVVNYSYPDPSYFNMVKVVVAYDNDPNQVSKILEEAIRSVDGVQIDRDVVAWLMELTEFHMVYWTAWWVATYQDRYSVQDRVIRAMMRALKEAGVVLPYQKGRYDIDIDSERLGSKKEWYS